MRQVLIKILILILFGIIFISVVVFLSSKSTSKTHKDYLVESDYYFEGIVLDEFVIAVDYYKALVISVDSIDFKKISQHDYVAAYNQESNTVVFFVAVAPYSSDSKESKPSYISVDSKSNSINFNDSFIGSPGNYKTIQPLGLYRKDFEKLLTTRGGKWIRF